MMWSALSQKSNFCGMLEMYQYRPWTEFKDLKNVVRSSSVYTRLGNVCHCVITRVYKWAWGIRVHIHY